MTEVAEKIIYDLSMFDVARWRPITPEQYLEALVELGDSLGVMDNYGKVESRFENIDARLNRFRVVTEAYVRLRDEDKNQAPEVEKQPWLMVLVNGGKSNRICFIRTDVDLEYA